MINRYSSRRDSLSESLLCQRLKNAQAYDRIAGYFRGSILEVAQESIESMTGVVRVICNSDLDIEDVKTAKSAQNAIRKEWCAIDVDVEEKIQPRYKRLYELLYHKKMIVKVLPDECFGLIHGKAGVITLEDGSKVSFLGSMNESISGWQRNYELVWEDGSDEAVQWVQEEFDALWHSISAVYLSDFVIQDIKRISERQVINSVDTWRKEEENPASVIIEAPVYRKEFGLWEHQKYFIDLAFKDHKKPYGARYVLADQVGLGKTIQLAISAQLMALHDEKPVLVIAPKTLLWQWQNELNDLLDLPCAVWDGKDWWDENKIRYTSRNPSDILKCPRAIGIISQGLITSKSETVNYLLEKQYSCVIVDETHRARRKNLGEDKESLKPVMNNLYNYLVKISEQTHSMLLATATPIQMYPVELWDLLNILSQKNDSVLGSVNSLWRKLPRIGEGLRLIMGKETKSFFEPENWDWIRNPFPPGKEGPVFQSLRNTFGMKDDQFVVNVPFSELNHVHNNRIGQVVANFFANYNPYIRHVVRRERTYLENTIDPTTGLPYLQRIEVVLYGEDNKDALVLTGYQKTAYELAEEFCKLLGERMQASGFLKTLLLRRLGSSIEAGRKTGSKILNGWTENNDDLYGEEDEEPKSNNDAGIKTLTSEEKEILERFVDALDVNRATDPKYEKVVELLRDKKWFDKGTIIFSQYLDTANWVAEKLSHEFEDTPIALYAGGDGSGYYLEGQFKKETKEKIKAGVKKRRYKILVGTDSASEGLNLQTLGCLINLDLPWNPTRLEQRKGRIQRIGQINDQVEIFNMRYKDSVEDRVHEVLSLRFKNITSVFGQLPDVLEDVWIEIANGRKEEALKIINNVPEVHPFENRYNNNVKPIQWENCAQVLDKKEKIAYFKKGW